MKQMVSKSQFKPKSLEYFRLIEESGQPLIITDRGRPVLKVIPYSETADSVDPLSILRNSVLRYDDPLEPVAPEDWKALK